MLGIETESRSRQTEELERLSLLLRRHGIAPSSAGDLSVEDRLVVDARQVALGAIRLYNDPSAGFRTETFIVLMIIAWNCLFQARLEHEGIEYREVNDDGNVVDFDGRARYLGTWDLARLALTDDSHAPIHWNLDFFLKLRHLIEHRYLPAVDVAVVGEAQALLFNFETLLVDGSAKRRNSVTSLWFPCSFVNCVPITGCRFLSGSRQNYPSTSWSS